MSTDGLTWTFHLKAGIHYAPPFDRTEITSRDIVTAIERSLRVHVEGANAPGTFGTTGFYFDVIKGASAYAHGTSESIEGLATPDERTLTVELTRPTGDLDYRFALPTTAPIPPSPTEPDAPFGVATGHGGGYGRFLVASGPYMIEGTAALDFTLPPTEQQPVSGYVPGRSLVFVRDPAWEARTDPLRPAYPDRIEFTIAKPATSDAAILRSTARLAHKIDADEVDVSFSSPETSQLERYRSDPTLEDRLYSSAGDVVWYLAMNLAVPPFDQVTVRRAVNLVIDKERLREAFDALRLPRAPALTADVATHIAPDGEEGRLLTSYDPYPSPNHGGDVPAARREMAASPYDLDGDGTCDAPTCKDLTAAGLACGPGIFGASLPTGKIVRRDLAKIGVTFGPDPECGALPPALDPTTHIPITADLWGPDYPDAGQFLQQLFSQSGKGTSPTALPQYRYSLVGASPEQLQAWGYRVQQVPSVDDQIDRCASLAFGARVTCWADLDRYLMTTVVPWVPLMHEENNWIVSSHVAAFSEDETGMPALDRIALEPGAM